MPSLSPKDLSRLAAFKTTTVAPGDVFFIPESIARYFRSMSDRPAVVVRVQRSPSGEPVLAYLVYGTTKRVNPKRGLPVAAGEAGLPKDTTFDFGPWLELPVANLLGSCEALGRLSEARIAELEAALIKSRLPFKGLAL